MNSGPNLDFYLVDNDMGFSSGSVWKFIGGGYSREVSRGLGATCFIVPTPRRATWNRKENDMTLL